ncbi:MAG TPA: glycosyltransferase [Stellaceae bacterium]|nr:glycosyltransferase [Stellaceae bacterium]
MTNRLRAAHVIAGLDPAYGGPSYSVPRLCEALASVGVETMLLSVAEPESGPYYARHKGYRDCRFAWDYVHIPILRRLRSSRALSSALYDVAPTADVIHSHGLWLMPNIGAGRAAAGGVTPLVVSPRGMLAPVALAFSRWKKRAFWALLQGPVIRNAACIHATSEQEYEEIRGVGLTNPVAIIPNGIDLPGITAPPAARPAAERVVLSLGRIHPKKGLARLVHAWSKVEAGYPGWRLRIVGPAELGHDDELRALAASLGLARISIEGPIYGEAKTAAYRDADIFVLPTLNENFGLTVAEALAAETPVISTKGAPWSGLEREGCGWWIDHGAEPLAAVLAHAMALPRDVLKAMGHKGRRWVARDFSWDCVARDMLCVYLWLTRDAEPPPTIRFG